MISETITIPKTISDQEDRFVLKLKENLLRMIKEINKNSKKIGEITNEEHEDPDYTDEFNKKANVNASNIGYGDLFLEIKDDEGEVIYSEQDNREDWGKALTNSKNTIASDNVTLVSSQNVYNETHPYMEKDSSDHWINPYHYINYKNLSRREGAEDINKQDRWSEQEFYEPNEPNDNTVKENLVALDTAVWEVAEKLNDKANISLDNINHTGGLVINAIARGSTIVQDKTALGEQDPLVKVAHQEVQDPETGLYTDIYTVYSDYDPSGGGGQEEDDTLYAQILGRNVGRNMEDYDIHGETTEGATALDDVKVKYYSRYTDDDVVINSSIQSWGYAISWDEIRNATAYSDGEAYYPPYSQNEGYLIPNLYAIRNEIKLPSYTGILPEADFIDRNDWDNVLISENYDSREQSFNSTNILDYAETTGHRLGNIQEAIFQLSASMLEIKELLGISGTFNNTNQVVFQPLFTPTKSKLLNGDATNDTTHRNACLNHFLSGDGYNSRQFDYEKFPNQTTYSETTPIVTGIGSTPSAQDNVIITPIADRRFTIDQTGCIGFADPPYTNQTTGAVLGNLPYFARIQKLVDTIDALVVQVNKLTGYVKDLDYDINDRTYGLKKRVSDLEGNSNNSSS